jgi:RNA-directed DNA polymerase
MSLATPIRSRPFRESCIVRRSLRSASTCSTTRFTGKDILRHAYALARANAGAPGVDGITFAAIEAAGLEKWLAGLREELVSKTYRPDPVQRVMIPKPNGEGERPLGIPTIRDRVDLSGSLNHR